MFVSIVEYAYPEDINLFIIQQIFIKSIKDIET